MTTLTLTQTGEWVGVILPKAVLVRLTLGTGDTVFVADATCGVMLTPCKPALRRATAALRLAALGLPLAACDRAGQLPAASAGAAATTTTTARTLQAAALAHDFSDPASFADAGRGLVAKPSGQLRDAAGSLVWDFDAFGFVKGKAPGTVHPGLWRQAQLNGHTGLFKVAERIWQLRGFDLANITLIEGETGWIVVDALTSRESAAHAMAFARQHLGPKPVSALIFTHSHVDHFGGALGVISAEQRPRAGRAGRPPRGDEQSGTATSAHDAARRAVPIVAPAGFMEEATSENLMAGTAMGRRAMYQFGTRLPRSALDIVDAGLGQAVAQGQIGILPPTLLATHTPQAMTLDGVRFVFHNVPGSEAPAELTFSLPDLKAYCGAEMLSHTLHNLHTLRGAKVRDALRWSQYIDEALGHADQAEVFFASHHWPVWGRERIQDFMAKQRDIYRYLHDQTVRLMNAGYSASEIAEEIKLPKSLDSFLSGHGYYGTVRHNVKGIVQFYLGWFDAKPAHLDAWPAAISARRYVDLAGGPDKATAAAQIAFDSGDCRWAAELLIHVVLASPAHPGARALQAATFDQLGYAAKSAVWRNFYLSGGLELRQGTPASGVSRASVLAMLRHTPVERFLEAMAASFNGPKAEGMNLKVNLVFTDLKRSFVLHTDNAVLHHREVPPAADAQAKLSLTPPSFLQMVTGQAGAKDLLLSEHTRIEGSRIDLGRFFALLDHAPGTFAIVGARR